MTKRNLLKLFLSSLTAPFLSDKASQVKVISKLNYPNEPTHWRPATPEERAKILKEFNMKRVV